MLTRQIRKSPEIELSPNREAQTCENQSILTSRVTKMEEVSYKGLYGGDPLHGGKHLPIGGQPRSKVCPNAAIVIAGSKEVEAIFNPVIA